MLFSRRKRATAVEPVAPDASANSNGAAADNGRSDTPTVQVPDAIVATSDAPATAVPFAPGEETGDADLDRFFAVLRQVVHDAREQVPLESDPLDTAEPATLDVPGSRQVHQDDERPMTAAVAVPTQPEHASTTELAPSNAELVSLLEDDRDRWRERAVVWRERAMGSDQMVKALNAHMSDLQLIVEDLRMVLRAKTGNGSVGPAPRPQLSAETPQRDALGPGT